MIIPGGRHSSRAPLTGVWLTGIRWSSFRS